jgi:hypothetical protein
MPVRRSSLAPMLGARFLGFWIQKFELLPCCRHIDAAPEGAGIRDPRPARGNDGSLRIRPASAPGQCRCRRRPSSTSVSPSRTALCARIPDVPELPLLSEPGSDAPVAALLPLLLLPLRRRYVLDLHVRAGGCLAKVSLKSASSSPWPLDSVRTVASSLMVYGEFLEEPLRLCSDCSFL